MRSCGQPVHRLGVLVAGVVGLCAAADSRPANPVYSHPTYTAFKTTFVLGFVHYFFGQSVSVRATFIHLIHRTNKDNDNFKLIITHRELCI